MDGLRTLLQSNLETISDVQSGVPIPDNIVEYNTNYFGYELQDDYETTTQDKFDTRRVSLIGRIVRKNNFETENTQQIIDEATRKVIEILKNLNFKTGYKDITLENGVRKILVTGNARYSEINYKLVI